jgi:hypothetical protein
MTMVCTRSQFTAATTRSKRVVRESTRQYSTGDERTPRAHAPEHKAERQYTQCHPIPELNHHGVGAAQADGVYRAADIFTPLSAPHARIALAFAVAPIVLDI